MTTNFSYITSFELNKAYLNECYDESVAIDKSIIEYKRAIISLVFGVVLLFFNLVSDYVAYFVLSLGILEVFSIYYRKPWWLWRQMFGKSYKSEVTMVIDDIGIHNSSDYVDTLIKWTDITGIEKTALGFIVKSGTKSNYLPYRFLNESSNNFIVSKIK